MYDVVFPAHDMSGLLSEFALIYGVGHQNQLERIEIDLCEVLFIEPTNCSTINVDLQMLTFYIFYFLFSITPFQNKMWSIIMR